MDEVDVIRRLVRGSRLPSGFLQIGDDVAGVPQEKGMVVLKVDMLVEGTDVPPGMTYREAARKAVASCVSDFAAKGVRPKAYMVSIGVRSGTTEAQIGSLKAGFDDASREWKVDMVGGDTNQAAELVIDCAMVGFSSKVVRRVGAREGDLVVVSDSFGLPPSGLMIMSGKADANDGFRERAVASVRKPDPNLDAGVRLARYLTSSMDSSDGLARSLHQLASAGGVGIAVDRLPAAKGVVSFAAENGLTFEDLVLYGGEEYCVVGTMARGSFERAKQAVAEAGGDLHAVGRVTARKSGIVLVRAKEKTSIRNDGWVHLRGG